MKQDLSYPANESILSTEADLTEEQGKAGWSDYVIVTKPGIIISNLLTTFTGLWVASHGILLWDIYLLTLLGTALVMASGTVLNSYVERDFDLQMERTKDRPLAQGRIHPQVALWYGLALGIIGLVVLALVEPIAALLGLIGLFVYVIVYTMWLKRTSTTNTVIGGISGAMPPIIGWSAVTHSLDPGAWALFAILFLWQPPHFLALAIRRSDEYRDAGFAMLPSVKGIAVTKREMLHYAAALVPASLFLYVYGAVGTIYLVTALVLGFIWVGLLVSGFYTKDVIRWSRKLFLYSLVYLMGMMVVMIADTL